MENGAMEKVIQLAMENAEYRTRFSILKKLVAQLNAYKLEHGYGGLIEPSEIESIMGWGEND